MDSSRTTALGRFLGFLICSFVFCSTAAVVAASGNEVVKKVNGHDAATCVMVYGDSTLSYTFHVMNTGGKVLRTCSKSFEQQDDKSEDNHLETGVQMSFTGCVPYRQDCLVGDEVNNPSAAQYLEGTAV